MAKKYKVKHYYGKDIGTSRAELHPVSIVVLVLVFVGLGYIGTIIYKPVYNFVMNIGKEGVVSSMPELSESVPTGEPEPETEPEPELEPEPVADFDKLRAVYAPFETVADSARFDAFILGLEDGY